MVALVVLLASTPSIAQSERGVFASGGPVAVGTGVASGDHPLVVLAGYQHRRWRKDPVLHRSFRVGAGGVFVDGRTIPGLMVDGTAGLARPTGIAVYSEVSVGGEIWWGDRWWRVQPTVTLGLGTGLRVAGASSIVTVGIHARSMTFALTGSGVGLPTVLVVGPQFAVVAPRRGAR